MDLPLPLCYPRPNYQESLVLQQNTSCSFPPCCPGLLWIPQNTLPALPTPAFHSFPPHLCVQAPNPSRHPLLNHRPGLPDDQLGFGGLVCVCVLFSATVMSIWTELADQVGCSGTFSTVSLLPQTQFSGSPLYPYHCRQNTSCSFPFPLCPRLLWIPQTVFPLASPCPASNTSKHSPWTHQPCKPVKQTKLSQSTVGKSREETKTPPQPELLALLLDYSCFSSLVFPSWAATIRLSGNDQSRHPFIVFLQIKFLVQVPETAWLFILYILFCFAYLFILHITFPLDRTLYDVVLLNIKLSFKEF